MSKKQTTTYKWHRVEIIGAILGLILIVSLISILQLSNFSEAYALPTYYVSSFQGNDSYPGTSATQPFKTVGGATKWLTDQNAENRSARIVILGEYLGTINLNGLGHIVLEGSAGGRITGSNAASGLNSGLVTIGNVQRVDIKGLELFPTDVTRPILVNEIHNESPKILNLEQNTLLGSEAIRIVNRNEGLDSGSLKVSMKNNIFKIHEASNKPLITDATSQTPRSKGLNIYLEVQDNFFEGYQLASTPLFNLDEISGFAKIWNNTFLARGNILLAPELVKLTKNIVAENDFIQENRFGQLSN